MMWVWLYYSLFFIGADVTDYFNYGFTEDTWRLYCEKQRKMRQEVNQLNKFVVRFSQPSPPQTNNTHSIIIMVTLLIVNCLMISIVIVNNYIIVVIIYCLVIFIIIIFCPKLVQLFAVTRSAIIC